MGHARHTGLYREVRGHGIAQLRSGFASSVGHIMLERFFPRTNSLFLTQLPLHIGFGTHGTVDRTL